MTNHINIVYQPAGHGYIRILTRRLQVVLPFHQSVTTWFFVLPILYSPRAGSADNMQTRKTVDHSKQDELWLRVQIKLQVNQMGSTDYYNFSPIHQIYIETVTPFSSVTQNRNWCKQSNNHASFSSFGVYRK